jgi:phosphoglycolate phosphatase
MKSVLFDFDGTLMDTWSGIENTIRKTLEVLGLPSGGEAVNRALVGMPLKKVFEKLTDGNAVQVEIATQKYRELFPITGMSRARPFEGVNHLLEELTARSFTLFLVTARNEIIANQMMEDHGLGRFFTWVRGEREGEVPDGKAHMVGEVVDNFELDPGNCIMVGDRKYDIKAARANGMHSIGVTYGYGTKEELMDAGAGKLVGSIADLAGVLLRAD